MNNTLSPKIYEILKKVTKGNIDNFTISVHDANKKGEGYLGQMFFISLQDKFNGKQLNFVVKQAFSDEKIRNFSPIRDVFLNEIYFYTKVCRTFFEFQEKISPKYRFVQVAKCCAVISEENHEKLLFENLKYQGFEIHDKKKPLDEGMFEFIFKVYGKLHAISFAYKTLNPEGFAELVNGVSDIWRSFCDNAHFQVSVKDAYENVLECFQPGIDDAVIEKYKIYINNGIDIFLSSLEKGKYDAILHGDCWSNNMMFKYDDNGKLEDVKFLDFQLVRLGSPVCDLAYCLYSGASKKTLDQLDDLLQIYHDSLSETLKAFGCDANELYPLDAIKKEWKTHCQFGVTMGLMLWRMKLTYDDEILDLTDFTDNTEDINKKWQDTKYDKKNYKERTRDLILHLYDNNFLYD